MRSSWSRKVDCERLGLAVRLLLVAEACFEVHEFGEESFP